jgi:hypothetical protein
MLAGKPQTLENIEKLRQTDSVAVVPDSRREFLPARSTRFIKRFPPLKLQLVSADAELTPFRFLDSDRRSRFAEIAETFVQNRNGCLSKITMSAATETAGCQSAKIALDDSIKLSVNICLPNCRKRSFPPN